MSAHEKDVTGIAIIGMAGRFPKAKGLDELWRNLRDGVEAITFFTDEELAAAGVVVPKGNPLYVKARGLLEGADQFDAGFFEIHPREAEIMDPQQRILLECAWEALEDAGYDTERSEALVGVFAGMSMNSYLLSNLHGHRELMDSVGWRQIMLGNDKDYLPTRVSSKLNLKGPSLNIQTGWSTSLVAVCVACQHLLNRQCDMALAGGVSVVFPQRQGHLFEEDGIGWPDGHCRAFDEKGQGAVAGEGAGMVVLKRLAEALAEGDAIYAVIKGFATNHNGSQQGGATALSADGQAEVIALAQAVAEAEPDTISYISAHGTGTPLGDAMEVAGLTKAFRARTHGKQFCALGSVPATLGHLDAAAGVTGLISTALALQHKMLPPSLHFETPNPRIDFENSPFYVNARLAEWKAGVTPRRAGVSSFGLGGANAHVVVEEAPAVEPSGQSRPAQLLLLSAKTAAALEAATDNLVAHLANHPEINLADAAYTLQVGRQAFRHRRMLVCRTPNDALEALRQRDPRQVFTREAAPDQAPVAFLFPGQGTQHPNLGRELYETEPVFREEVDVCAEILQSHLKLDLRALLYPPADQIAAAQRQLAHTFITQPAAFVISYALAKLWISWGVQPQAMIGHSSGEYVAACMAGVMSLPDALRLVAARGRMMQQLPGGSMLAIRLPEKEIQALLQGNLALAAVNSPDLCVVSGPTHAIEALRHHLSTRRVGCRLLQTSHAFHSAMMDPVLGPFGELLKAIQFQAPRIPFISNVTADWITTAEATDPAYWIKHTRHTVRFSDGVAILMNDPRRILLEVGPGQTLSLLARRHPAKSELQPVVSSLPQAPSGDADGRAVLNALGRLWLGGAEVDWSGFYAHERRRRVRLPAYPFERQRCWIEPVRTPRPQPDHGAGPDASTMAAAVVIKPEGNGRTSDRLGGGAAALNRNRSIVSRLKALLSGLSGLDLTRVDDAAPFVEMGLDPVSLTQMCQTMEQEFQTRIGFKQLVEEFSNFGRLANRIEQAGVFRVDAEPMPGAPRTEPARPPRDDQPTLNGELEGVFIMPLTEGQKEIWFAARMGDEASSAFNISWLLHLRGPFQLPSLCKAIQSLMDRHEALRTTFSPAGDFQQIAPRLTIPIPLEDFTMLEEEQRERRLQSALAVEVNQAFDLIAGPLVRVRIFKLADKHHLLAFTVHHIVCDGGSMGILLGELGEFYSAAQRGVQPSLAAPMQFSQYVDQQQGQEQSPERLAAEAYWLGQFATPPPLLDLPTDRPHPPVKSFRGAVRSLRMSPTLCRALKQVSARQRCTLFTTLLAAYYAFLRQLAGQDDLVVGVPMSDRTSEGSEGLVGHCVNFLPLRARVDGSAPFGAHLANIRGVFIAAYEHQNYTFGNLIRNLNLPRTPGRTPLLSVSFNMDGVRNPVSCAGLDVEALPHPDGLANFDLAFDLAEVGEGLNVDCTYHREVLEEATVKRWLEMFQAVLAAIATNPNQRLSDLAPALAAEREQMLSKRKAPDEAASLEASARSNGTSAIDVDDEPRTAVERELARIWCEVIDLPRVGRHDDFFELGGHSVLVTQILSRIRKMFQIELSLRTVFEAPTVCALAEVIEEHLAGDLDGLRGRPVAPMAAKESVGAKGA